MYCTVMLNLLCFQDFWEHYFFGDSFYKCGRKWAGEIVNIKSATSYFVIGVSKNLG